MYKNPYFLWTTDDTAAIKGFVKSDCVLVCNGAPRAYIVIEPDDDSAQKAADVFIESVAEMTGCRLPIGNGYEGTPIYLGTAAVRAADLAVPEAEGFALAISESEVYAAGNDNDPFTGTAFAVTAMLEALGFGWFGPEKLWQVTPQSNNAVLPAVNTVSRPHFISRRNRVLEQQPELGIKWGLGGVRSEIEHKYGHFFPPHKYEETHPEYYAFSSGTRSTKEKKWWELCLSNKEVQEGVARQVCEFFREHPEWHGYSIGQNDGNGIKDSVDYANWCECEECKKFAPTFSDAVLRFSNKVASLVYKEFPDRTLMFYGYFGTYPAPTVPCPEPISPNLQLTLCKECGFTGRIRTNESCTDAEHPPFAENYEEWKKQGLRHIAIYEWNCPGAANPAWKEAFWVQGDVGFDNLRWFYENGVDFVYFDQGPNDSYERRNNPFPLRWPQWYCMAHACYNTGLKFEEVMRDACAKLYGNAADRMFDFYKTMQDANAHCRYPHFNWGLPLVGEIYDEEYLAAVEKALCIAESTEGLCNIQRERIAVQRAEWEKTKKMALIQ